MKKFDIAAMVGSVIGLIADLRPMTRRQHYRELQTAVDNAHAVKDVQRSQEVGEALKVARTICNSAVRINFEKTEAQQIIAFTRMNLEFVHEISQDGGALKVFADSAAVQLYNSIMGKEFLQATPGRDPEQGMAK